MLLGHGVGLRKSAFVEASHTGQYRHRADTLALPAARRENLALLTSVESEGVQKELSGAKLRLTSSVFGFPDFRSLIELTADGKVIYSAGMISKEPGAWAVVNGDPRGGEHPEELFLQFTQPLTDQYKKVFDVPGGTCFWRGRIGIKSDKSKNKKVVVEGGVVVSENGKKKLVREGSFTAMVCSAEEVKVVRMKGKEAFERAMLAPRGEATGFKTPARIAGVEKRSSERIALKQSAGNNKQAALKAAEEQSEYEKKAARSRGMEDD